jgi:hypothetical protein
MNKTLLAGLALAVSCAAQAQVFANNSTPGDTFTNAGGSNQGQAVGSSGWYYNNVRNSGSVGINIDNAYNGNGSVRFDGTVGPGGNSSKADIEYLSGGVNVGGNYYATSSLGSLSDFVGMSYNYYRDSASTNSGVQMLAGRILIDADGDLNTINDRGGLVFESIYNGGGTAPVDAWTLVGIGANTNLWSFGAGMTTAQLGYGTTLSDWQSGAGTVSGDSAILGFSFGVGSGWGPNTMYLDDVTWQLDTVSTNSNFEVVPEPASMTLLALGAIAALKKRKSK